MKVKQCLFIFAFMLCCKSNIFSQPLVQVDDAERKRLLDIAMKYKGVPYVYGAESPKAFDCSGFVRYVYREAFGIDLPRSSRDYPSVGSPIDWKKANVGDVFIYDTVGGRPSHVSIFAGNGQVIHAVSAGPLTGVILSPLTDKYWSSRLIAARAFLATAPAVAAAKSVAATAPPGPSASKPGAVKKEEVAISELGIEIPAKKIVEVDKIPTAAGTSLSFTITNTTGAESNFTILFFRVNPKTYKLEPIHEERVKMKQKESISLPPYRFDNEGKYKLIIKDSWGNQLVEREFMVTAAKA